MDWSMVICTLNRFEVLKCALRSTLWQTCLPRQVIVVDASPDWQRCREQVLAQFGAASPAIEWIYIGSERRSLTHQRNLGLARCTSEIVFFFDDDTFLYPDCASRILSVYRRDVRGEVGGVSAGLREVNPLDSGVDLAPVHAPAAAAPSGAAPADHANRYRGLGELIRSLWYPERLFMPYDGLYHRRTPDWSRADASLMTVAVFHGCRMTFRCAAVREAGGCEEALVRHAFSEDIDISYRVSRRRALLLDMDARVFHATAPASRTGRISQATLVLLNSAVLYLLHETGSGGRNARVRRFLLTRLAIETVRDALRPWRGFPNSRGAVAALRELPSLLRQSRDELRQGYPLVQQRITDARL
jgi:glycosyltransferase involved in cell wall biosynthesis